MNQRRSACPNALVIAAFLTVHACLVAWLGFHQSPNIDEPAHLAAAMAMWQYGRFDLYCVNPPLMRAVATLPVLATQHEAVWGDFKGAPQPRPEFVLGAQFVESHPDCWRRLLVAARWAILPFTLLGALVCYLWAAELFGHRAGWAALALWCFCPNIITWSSVICTDGAAAATGVAAGYTFWRWLRRPTWRRAVLAGIFLGLALLSKLTWLVIVPLWPAIWALWRAVNREAIPANRPTLPQLVTVLLIGIYVVNLGYAFDGTLTPLGKFEFTSRLFGGAGASGDRKAACAPEERASPTPQPATFAAWKWLPVPLPADFVRGVDLQRADFEKGNPPYLFGEWADDGCRYYYLVGLAIKVPLGTWCLALLAMLGLFERWRRQEAVASTALLRDVGPLHLLDHVVLVAPAVAVLALASSQSGFSGHFRYVLPAFPFAFIWISQSAAQMGRDRPFWSAVVIGVLLWSMGSSLAAFPHMISYFNELAGGSANGHRYMLGSSLSWSQDHFYLQEWLARHPEADSPYMLLDRTVSLERLGLCSRGEPPPGTAAEATKRGLTIAQAGPLPGWHVVSLQRLHDPDGAYLYFDRFEPAATIGYSTRIYDIKLEDANRVRRATGIPEITEQPPRPARLLKELAEGRSSLRPIKVALFSPVECAGAPALEPHLREVVEKGQGLLLSTVTAADIRDGCLESCDLLLVPGGQASAYGSSLGSAGRIAIRDFVRSRGGYVGVCAGAHLACVSHEWGLKLVNARAMSGERFVPGFGRVSASFRGRANVSIEFSKAGRRVFDVASGVLQMDYAGGPVLSRANEPGLPDYVPLACFRSEASKYPFQKGTMIDTPAVVAAKFGQGRIVLFSPHPESTASNDRLLAEAIRACAPDSPPGITATAR
ncbi:MAG: BPL-N domain-containing protein [Pirellulales bacterium]